MITLEYDAVNGNAYPDGACDEIVRVWALNLDKNINIAASTENIFYALRVAIMQGKIPHKSVLVKFNGQYGEYDKDGRSDFWPDGFCDYDQKKTELLIGWND